MSEKNVLDCILIYRSDSYKDLLKKYDNNADAMHSVLKGYPGLKEYHGHASASSSGASTSGVSDSANKNLDAAISYLKTTGIQKYNSTFTSSTPKTINKEAKQNGIAKHEALNTLIAGYSDLGALQVRLSELYPGWNDTPSKNKAVKEAYDAKKNSKKMAKKTAKK